MAQPLAIGQYCVSGTVDGIDIAARDAVLTSTTTTAGAALPKAGGTMTGSLAITTASTADTVTLTRGTTGQNNMLKFKTGSSDKWIVGQRNDSTDHFRFYSYGTSSDVVSILTDGKVGIGNTNPQGRLHLNDSGTTIPTSGYGTGLMVSRTDGLMGTMFGFLNSPQSGYLQVANFTNTDTLPFLINPRGGNVGIGVSDPDSKLEIKGSGGALGLTFKTTDASSNETFWINDGGRVGVRYGPLLVGIPSGTTPATSAVFQVEEAGLLTVLSTGKVGIGTTSPESLLTIQNDDAGIRLRSNTTTAKGLTLRYNHAGNFGQLLVDHQGNNQLAMKYYALSHSFGRSDSDVNVIMDDSGRLLVGSTTTDASTSERFLVKSTGGEHSRFVNSSDTYTTVYIKNTSTTANTNQPFLTFQDTGGNRGNLGLRYSTAQLVIQGHGGVGIAGGSGFNQDPDLFVNSSGNVGIGTSSPTGYRLVVENTSEDLLKLHNSTDGLDSLISFTNPGGTLGRVQGIDNGGLGFDVGNNAGGIISNAMSIANTGRVGVGVTQTDPVKFEVNSGTGEHNVMRIRFSDDNNSNATANPFSYEYKSLEIENQYSGAAPSANGTKVAKLQLTTVTAGGYAASSSIMGVAESNGHEAGAMVFATGPNSSGNEVERMRISRTGNVGIGRTDPQQLLEVHKAAGGDQTVAKFSAHNYGDTGKTFIEIGTEYGDGSSRIGSFNDTGNKSVLVFDTHDATSGAFAERMRITSAGKVAIGAGGAGTSGTHTKLEVHGAIAAGSTQGTGGSLVLYQRYGVNDMPATLSTHYSNSYWFLATGMKARSGAAGYVSSLGNYSTARAGIDVNNSSIKFLYVPAATVAVDTVLTPSTPFDMNLDTGTLMLTNGASGTSNGIVFKETNNSDLNKYIKQTAYYMQYNGHPNEGHHFTTSGSQSQLRIHGPTNGTRPSSVDVTATNGLYVNNAQRIESDGTMKPSALEIGVQNIGATLGAYHGKVVHSASNGFTMHQYSKYFESWNATTGVVIDVLETSNDTANWNGNKSIIIEVRQSSYNGGGYARYYFNNQYDENSLETIDASAGADSNTPLSVTGLTVVTGNVKKSKVQITLGYYQQAYVTVYSTMTTSSSITAANQLRFL